VRFDGVPYVRLPPNADSAAVGFQAGAVAEVVVHFEVGKFSNTLRKQPYPLSGTLLLSEIHIEDDPRSPALPQPATKHPALEKKPVPIETFEVGINYPFQKYGFDVGLYPFGGRDICGFSSHQFALDRDFRKFREHGIGLVRVFVLADLRTGALMDRQGAITGLDRCVGPDINALVDAAARNSLKLMPVLIDFLIADGSSPEQEPGTRRWTQGEYPHLIVDPNARRGFVEKALRPIVRTLAEANRRHGSKVVAAVDIVNELENATTVFQAGGFGAARGFVREVRDMIRKEAPSLKITLGSRNRDDLVDLWSEMGFDVWQFHYYDRMEEEEKQPLHFPAGALGLRGPVLIGEVEPSAIGQKLDTIYADGYDGALFWAYRSIDGFEVDLREIKRWLDKMRKTANR
jgi:hypothetical protein